MALALFLARAAEGHALIEGYVVADNGRLADDDAHAVIDEQPFADLCARMDFNSREEAGDGRNDAGCDKPFVQVEEMSQAVCPDSVQSRVAQQDFQGIFYGRVSFLNDVNVLSQGVKHEWCLLVSYE